MKSRERTSSVLVCWVTFVFAWTAISMLTISTGVGAKTRLDNASDSAAIRFREKMKLPAPKRVSGIKLPLSSAREGRKQFIVQLRTLPVAKAVSRGRNVSARQIAHHRQLQAEQTAFMAYCNQFGAKVVGRTQVVLNAVFLEADMANLPEIAKYDAVMSIRAIRNYQMFLSETVPYIGASDVQAAGFDGSGIRIAVLDSGIDYTHAHFAGPGTREAYEAAYGTDLADPRNTRRDALFPTAKVVGGFDFVGEFWDGSDTSPPFLPDADPIDAQGHGTHVADIIGGLNGVAPGAELYAVFGDLGRARHSAVHQWEPGRWESWRRHAGDGSLDFYDPVRTKTLNKFSQNGRAKLPRSSPEGSRRFMHQRLSEVENSETVCSSRLGLAVR